MYEPAIERSPRGGLSAGGRSRRQPRWAVLLGVSGHVGQPAPAVDSMSSGQLLTRHRPSAAPYRRRADTGSPCVMTQFGRAVLTLSTMRIQRFKRAGA